jgi:hypothetical protein
MLQTLVQGCLSLEAFLKTQPPIFYKAKEPLEAQDWIRTIELKFSLIHYSDVQKTQFAVVRSKWLEGG